MREYATNRIRNVCLVSHGGHGKTMLAEAMLFNTGVLERFGKVMEGNTATDFDPEEIRRQISINTALAPCEWKDNKINVIDTPGYFDFVGEVKQGVRVADSALILVSAKGGVLVGTEKSWGYAKENNLPRAFLINKMDDENADFDKVFKQLTDVFGSGIVCFQIPIIEGEKFAGYVDVISQKAYKFDKDKANEVEMPATLKSKVEGVFDAINESIAETDEQLMEKYFAGEAFTNEERMRGLRAGILAGTIYPVFCGSAYNNINIKALMDSIAEYMPSPADRPATKAKKPGSDNVVEIKPTCEAPMASLVFKTIVDPFVGRISMVRVYSGVLKSDSTAYNTKTEKVEKFGQLFIQRGKKQIPVDKLVAGDIGAVAKLAGTMTNHTLCDQSNQVELEPTEFPIPNLVLAIEPKAKGDEEKISSGLTKLMDEDPTFKLYTNKETHQTLISGMGEQHLDVIVSKLKAKFGVGVTLIEPKVPYREAIKKKVKVEGKHKKQSGGHGQYGHVWIEFEPGEGNGLTFEEKVFGGSVPKNYFPAVEKGLAESMGKGVLAGYPMANLKATLVDGSYHAVDSSEMAFKIAANLAYKKGLAQATPILLEPIMNVKVLAPDTYTGDIIGDMNKRRGRILGMNPTENGLQEIVAEVPQSEIFKYANDLRSMTQGRGNFFANFERYEEVPGMISTKIIDEAKKTMTDDDEE